MSTNFIEIKGASEHNLQNIDVKIPKNQLVVITGLSGSGKSSLAFDTIYAEGKRLYFQSISSYARNFLQIHSKPKLDSIKGLSPAIAIDQKSTARNPRSTVGTITEIYDYFRLLFSSIGDVYSPKTGKKIVKEKLSKIINNVLALPKGTTLEFQIPLINNKNHEELLQELRILEYRDFNDIIINDKYYKINKLPKFDTQKKYSLSVVYKTITLANAINQEVTEAVTNSFKLGKGIIHIKIISAPKENITQDFYPNKKITFSQKYICDDSDFMISDLEPRLFSFNSPFGACRKCEGLGKKMLFDKDLIVPDKTLSINEGALAAWNKPSKVFFDTLKALANHYDFSLDEKFADIAEPVKDILCYGSGTEKIKFTYHDNYNTKNVLQKFAGIIPSLEFRETNTQKGSTKENMNHLKSYKSCYACNGYRIKSEHLQVKINDLHIGEVADKTILELKDWFQDVYNNKLDQQKKSIAKDVINEITQRLDFLESVGLEYLSVSRDTNTLSGGELQRIRLASQIGSQLTGVLYVLDEPSIGLHPKDNYKLIQTLKKLRDLGNSVIVVEHDEETMISADYIIDLGPAAGKNGGKIVAQGTYEEVKNNPNSITGLYLSKKEAIPIKISTKEKDIDKEILLKGASSYNLKDVNLSIKLKLVNVITGVSGSGKSTLIDTLHDAVLFHLDGTTRINSNHYSSLHGIDNIDNIVDVNQTPIGRTPRSNPATYIGLFNLIRDLFANLDKSKMRDYTSAMFSFNVKGGRCEDCQGDGSIKIEMHFLPDFYVKCDSCDGKRYTKEVLDIKYKNKNISDILNMSVGEALNFFIDIPMIHEKLATLDMVGLGYIALGQAATTLSGGEAQRIKLAKELTKKSTGRTLYLLDEPTTGLHIADIKKLLTVLHKLADKGNTVVVVEHNFEVVKTANYIIDIGPEGGKNGGKIIAEGTAEEVALNTQSYTGRYLKEYFMTHGFNNIKNYELLYK